MLRNYLKTIIRSIRRNRTFTLINVVGLSLGLAAFIAITEYVRFEKSYDTYHKGYENIVRVGIDVNFGDGDLSIAYMGAPGTKQISADFPQVTDATRLYYSFRRDFFVKVGEREFKQKPMTRMMADENFFSFFSIPLIQGNPDEVLNGPNKVVLTASTAERYFGNDWQAQTIVGSTIELGEDLKLLISGICEDVPDNTHFDFELLVSMKTVPEAEDNFWLSNSFYHYFRLRDDSPKEEFLTQLNSKAGDYLNNDINEFLGKDYSDLFSAEGNYFRFYYQPIADIHLGSHRELEIQVNGEQEYVDIFTAVSVLVLLMAAINFMNLSTVSGLKRHKEVGIRKVLGSLKGQVIFQFLLESVMIVLFSLVFAVTLIQLLAPTINAFFGAELIRPLAALFVTIGWLVLGAVGLGVLSGIYPAWTLSSINPSASIKGVHQRSGKVGFFRNLLIVFQFAISLLLIIGVWGIQQQLSYMKTRDLGYQKDQVMIIEDTNELGEQAKTFRDRLAASPLVNSATVAGFVPIGSDEYGTTGFNLVDGSSDLTLRLRFATVDEYYIDTYGLELISGRNFSTDFGDESANIIVNESVIKSWGWSPEEALGQKVRSAGDQSIGTIIGVMKDFQTFSMKSRNDPFFLAYEFDNQNISVRFTATDWTAARELASTTWSEFTDKPFSYSMADALFESTFANEEKAGQLFTVFSSLALFIGCLGLLGVASYVIVQRSKEVGIRKVLGASITQLFGVLSKDFIWLILIAGVVSVPAAYYFLGSWLDQYAYQVGLTWWLFVVPFLFVGLLAFGIIGAQIWKVAIINPIKSLRYE
ncbi:MAG: FtsX-like permease family protein [Roseivirga sp.]|nr:FtsX-like permease family protein [Roseivirga sp.]